MTVAPTPPFKSTNERWPAGRRTEILRRLSRNASPRLRARLDAIERTTNTPGIIPIALRPTGVALTVDVWLPAGTDMNWGEGAPVNVPTDGVISHTYSASGTYQVSATN